MSSLSRRLICRKLVFLLLTTVFFGCKPCQTTVENVNLLGDTSCIEHQNFSLARCWFFMLIQAKNKINLKCNGKKGKWKSKTANVNFVQKKSNIAAFQTFLVVIQMLLLLSGNVELNPGPVASTGKEYIFIEELDFAYNKTHLLEEYSSLRHIVFNSNYPQNVTLISEQKFNDCYNKFVNCLADNNNYDIITTIKKYIKLDTISKTTKFAVIVSLQNLVKLNKTSLNALTLRMEESINFSSKILGLELFYSCMNESIENNESSLNFLLTKFDTSLSKIINIYALDYNCESLLLCLIYKQTSFKFDNKNMLMIIYLLSFKENAISTIRRKENPIRSLQINWIWSYFDNKCYSSIEGCDIVSKIVDIVNYHFPEMVNKLLKTVKLKSPTTEILANLRLIFQIKDFVAINFDNTNNLPISSNAKFCNIKKIYDALTNNYPRFNVLNNYKQNAFTEKFNTKYFYNKKDIEVILNKLLSLYKKKIIINAPLGIKDYKNLRKVMFNFSSTKIPTLIPIQVSTCHWVAIVLTSHKEKEFAFYKDSYGNNCFQNERKFLKSFFSKHLKNLTFFSHPSQEQIYKVNSGVHVIANLNTMIMHILNNFDTFYTNFESCVFLSHNEICSQRYYNYPDQLILGYYQKFQSSDMIFNELEIKNNETMKDEIIQITENQIPLTNEFKLNPFIMSEMFENFVTLLNNGWDCEKILYLINVVNKNEEFQKKMSKVLQIYLDYMPQVINKFKCDEFASCITNFEPNNWVSEIHKNILSAIFRKAYEKDQSQIISKLLDENKEIPTYIRKNLSKDVDSIIQNLKKKSVMFPDIATIGEWNASLIKNWSLRIKNSRRFYNNLTLFEEIAVVYRAVEISLNKQPKITQIVMVLLMMYETPDIKGKLAQMSTGQGKTIAIAMLAILKVLRGHTVDIITSSPELAMPQSAEMTPLYDLFHISVAHNSENLENQKTCYANDIVYGEASDFQADIIRENFFFQKIKLNRKCNVAIVDEVDSMLIDGSNYFVKISSYMPGMQSLRMVIFNVWTQLQIASKQLESHYGYGYIFSENISQANQFESKKCEHLKQVVNNALRKLLCDDEGIVDTGMMEIYENADKPKLLVPNHLRELLLDVQLICYIESAIFAKYFCQESKSYVTKNNEICIVDADNTGVLQNNTRWSNGLHQFLQIKHNLAITTEMLTTNFLSNVSFFKKYNQIYGMTGTLGQRETINLLKKVYSVSSLNIPSFVQKRYFEMQPQFETEISEWYVKLIKDNLIKVKVGRACLIIMQYIKEAKNLKNIFINTFNYPANLIKLYLTGENADVLKGEINSGDIIIATNIAGRGTDLIISENVNKNGGLHVCVSFLPRNSRTQSQNFGRTSRIGNMGSGKIILKKNYEDTTFKFLETLRNSKENRFLSDAPENINKISIKEEIVNDFVKFSANFHKKIPKYKFIYLSSLRERFGIYLKLKNVQLEKIANKVEAEKFFKKFEDEILEDFENDRFFKNVYYLILLGNELIKENKFENAHKVYTRAIELDNDFAENAYYYRAYATIAQYCNNVKDNKNEITSALDDFKEAKIILNIRIADLDTFQKWCTNENFSNPNSNLRSLISYQIKTIDNAIKICEKCIKTDTDFNIQLVLIQSEYEIYKRELYEIINNGFFMSIDVYKKDFNNWKAFTIQIAGALLASLIMCFVSGTTLWITLPLLAILGLIISLKEKYIDELSSYYHGVLDYIRTIFNKIKVIFKYCLCFVIFLFVMFFISFIRNYL